MLLTPSKINVRTVSILANLVFFVVGFNYSFFNSLLRPLVSQSLTFQYDSEYATANIGKYCTAFAAAIHICGTIANPIFGEISDRFGRRLVVLASMVSATLCLVSFATLRGFWMLMAARIVTGLFDSSQFVTKVILGDVATPETQKTLFSQLYSCFALCLIVGPFIVSLFQNNAAWQITGPCIIAGSISFLCFIACLVFLPETKARKQRANRCTLSWYQVLARADLAIPVWSYGLLSMCLAAGEICTALYISEKRGGLALAEVNTGRLFAIQGVAYCLTQALFSSRLLKKYGNIFMFRATLAAMTFLYPLTILAAFTHFKFVTLALIMSSRAFANSIAVSSINLIINENGSNAGALGSVAAVGQSLCGLTKTILLCTLGIVYDMLASRGVVYLSFILIGLMMALLSAFSLTLRSSSSIPISGKSGPVQLPERELFDTANNTKVAIATTAPDFK